MFKSRHYYKHVDGNRFDLYILSCKPKEMVVSKKFGLFPVKQKVYYIHAIAIDSVSGWSAGQFRAHISLDEYKDWEDVSQQYWEMLGNLLADSEQIKPSGGQHWN